MLPKVPKKAAAGRPRVMAVASAGGHWVQLLRLRPAWEGCDCTYVVTRSGYKVPGCNEAAMEGEPRVYAVKDANLSRKPALLVQLAQMIYLLLKERPDVVVTTGASVGYFAVRLGKLLGARTVWVDSIANADEMSVSGQRVRPYADLWLTQWPGVAEQEGGAHHPRYVGSVI